MSVRYSGDAEVRLAYDRKGRVYRGRVSDPALRFRGWVPLDRGFARDPTCPEAYDDAARRLAELARDWARSEGLRFMVDENRSGVRIRRGFQAPCPLEDL